MELASGFETGGGGEFDGGAGSPSYRTDGGHCGDNYMRCDEGDYRYWSMSNETTVYMRGYFRIQTGSPGSFSWARIMQLDDNSAGQVIWYLKFETGSGGDKKVCFVFWLPSKDYNHYNFNWQTNTWYHFEVKFLEHGSSGEYRVWLDGTEIVTRTGMNTSLASGADRGYFGMTDADGSWTPVIDVDCCVAMDTGPIDTHEHTFGSSFETVDFSEWDATEGSPSIQALRRHCGIYSMYCYVPSGDDEGPYINIGHHKEGQVMLEVQFDELPADGTYIEFFKFMRDGSTTIMSLRLRNNSGNYEWGFGYRAAGSLSYDWDADTQNNPAVDTWHCVKAEIFLSPENGTATADYTMTVNDAALDDANKTNVDSDYTGFTDLYAMVTTDDTRARVFIDCIEFETTAIGACHDAGSEDVESLESFALSECTVDETRGVGPVQLWVNCLQQDVVAFSVTDEARGVGEIIVPYSVNVERLDTVHVFAYGKNLMQGLVASVIKNRGQGIKRISVQTKTLMLYGRIIEVSTHRAYEGYDVGEVAADLIDFYFDGYFTGNGINQSIGHFVTTIDLFERSVGTGFEDLARRGNCAFHVDEDNDVHFFERGAEDSGYTIEERDLAGDVEVDLVGDVIRKIIVKGDGVSASAGSGLPERVISDRRITTNEEAEEIALAYLTRYASQTLVTIPVRGFWLAKNGQTIRLNSPQDQFINEALIVSRMNWQFNEGQCITTVSTGDDPPEFDFIFREIQKELQEKEVNRISEHVGTEGGDGDPFAISTEILNTSNAGVALNQNEVTLVTGACSSESDAANACEITITITRNSGDWVRARIRVYDGSNNLYMFYIALFTSWNNAEPWVDRRIIADDLSGKTITVYIDPASDQVGNVDGAITIDQFTEHAHSTAQGGDHEFD